MTIKSLSVSAALRIARGGVLATLVAFAAVLWVSSRTVQADPVWQFPASGVGSNSHTEPGCLNWRGYIWDCVVECLQNVGDGNCSSTQWQFQRYAFADEVYLTLTGPGKIWLISHNAASPGCSYAMDTYGWNTSTDDDHQQSAAPLWMAHDIPGFDKNGETDIEYLHSGKLTYTLRNSTDSVYVHNIDIGGNGTLSQYIRHSLGWLSGDWMFFGTYNFDANNQDGGWVNNSAVADSGLNVWTGFQNFTSGEAHGYVVNFSTARMSDGGWCEQQLVQTADYNGDGKADIAFHDGIGQHVVTLSNGNGTFASPVWWSGDSLWCDSAHLRSGDYNGDGKTDMSCHDDAGHHIVAFSNGDGTFTSPGWWNWGSPWCDPAHLRLGDYNGDGKTDLSCHSDTGYHIVAFSNGDGTFSSPGWWGAQWCDPAHLTLGDFNGDGKIDLSCHSDTGYHILAFSNGDGTFSSPGWWGAQWCDPAHLRFGDYNGDGKLDLSCHHDAGYHIVAFSNGDGTFSSPGWWNWGSPWCDPSHLRSGDYNCDGKLDLSCHDDAGHHIIAFSNGDGTFSSPGWWNWDSPWCDPSHLTSGDFNGDGKLDLACHQGYASHIVAFSNGDGTFSSPGWWP